MNGESKKCVATAALSPAAATATPPPVHSVLGQTQYPCQLVRDIQVKYEEEQDETDINLLGEITFPQRQYLSFKLLVDIVLKRFSFQDNALSIGPGWSH